MDENQISAVIVDAALDDACPIHTYEPGSWGPVEADQLAAELGGWYDPNPPA